MTEPPPRNNRDRDRVADTPQRRSRSPYHTRKPKEGNHKKERRMKRKREGVTQKQIKVQKNPLIPAIWPKKKQKNQETPAVWPKEYHRNREGRLAAKKRRSESSSNNSGNNQIEKLTKVKSQSEIDKERNSESWLKEQQLFRECEIKYMHLIQRWEKAIRNENSNQILCLYKKEFLTSSNDNSDGNDNDGNSKSKIESFSAPFIEEYKLKRYIKQSKGIIDEFGNDDEDTKSIVKKVQDKFARTYGSKKRHVPKGFEAKLERKEKKEDTTVDEYTGERIIKTVIRTENDIVVVKSRVKPNSHVDQQKIFTVLDHVLDMGGKPTTTTTKSKSYRQQFITATKSNAYMSQQIVAESMLKDVRKCMGGVPVRFLRKIPKTQAFVEEKKDIARSALSNAISLYLSSTTSATSSETEIDTGTTDDTAEANAVTTVTTDVTNEDADADADSSPAVESESVADADASSDSNSDTDSTTSNSDSD